MQPFRPIIFSPHLLTIAANFWPRRLDTDRFPIDERLYRTEPDVQVLVRSQRPAGPPAGEVVLVHGLEGSSEAGYMRSTAQAALEAGFAVHRFNLRCCGGTEALCPTMYHAGLTCDLLAVLREFRRQGRSPVHLAGFSLGGNIVLKLAGELGEEATQLIASVCGISAPIDLAACVRRLAARENRLYERRFVGKMKQRLRRKHHIMPDRYPLNGLERLRTVFEIDDRLTAPLFGFRDAAHYYATQSAILFLEGIRVPALFIQAQDDPLVPFGIFRHPAFRRNSWLKLAATRHGGHLGFISSHPPRWWSDHALVEWFVEQQRNKPPVVHVNSV